jgi:hypothetical protein
MIGEYSTHAQPTKVAYQMSFHLLHLNLDGVEGLAEHFALFHCWKGHDCPKIGYFTGNVGREKLPSTDGHTW